MNLAKSLHICVRRCKAYQILATECVNWQK